MKITIFEKKKLRRLTNKHQQAYEKAKICYICTKKLKQIYLNGKEHQRNRDNCHYTGKYRDLGNTICSLKYSRLSHIHVTFRK